MPLIMNIMDDMAKGQPVSSTYFDLWCRTFDEGFVTLSKPREMAFHAGFDGQRAERTWKARLQILADLHFISLKEGPSGPASYALLLNPYKVIKWHYEMKRPGLRHDKYNALLERAIEIGDESMTPPEPTAVAPEGQAATVAPVASVQAVVLPTAAPQGGVPSPAFSTAPKS